MNVQAIIPAAGSGRRFGAAKQFQLLSDRPLFLYALQAFEASPSIQGVWLVVPQNEVEDCQSILQRSGFKKIIKVLAGGKERQDSVKIGFESLPVCDFVAIHDAVRPLVTSLMIEKVIEAAKKEGAALAAIPLSDTIKKVRPDLLVSETVDREGIWRIQTPQVFRYDLLQKAYQKASQDHFQGTDEAMLVERIGAKIQVVPGSPSNIKVTSPEDLAIAEALLKRQRVPT